MPISQEVLQSFLTKVLAEPPKCKGMHPDRLRELIYNSTGCEFEEVTKSRPHQLEGLAYSLYLRRSLLFYWMQLGKTKIALDWASHLRRANLIREKCLIIAHAPIGVDVWESQAKQHSNLDAIAIRSGPKAVGQLLNALESDCEAVIISQYSLETYFTIKKYSERKNKLKLYPDHDKLRIFAKFFDHCIIDETHFYSSQYGLPYALVKAAIQDCDFRLGLTGTPVGRDPYKIWAQAALIDDGQHFGYQYRFFEEAFGKRTYSHFRKSHSTLVFDKKKMDIFQYKLDSFSLSYGKGEVKSAEVMQGIVRLRMHDKQKKAYNDAVHKLIQLTMNEQVPIEQAFVRLRQIASGFLPFRDNDGQDMMLHFPSAKLDWLREFASEGADAQCLIFHEYIHSGELIEQVLREARVPFASVRGATKDKAGEIARFRSGKARFLVANTQSGGTSIALPEADYICFFESPCDPKLRAQAAARPMARGDRLLVIDDLICAPIEDKILSFIKDGENLLRLITRGGKKTAQQLFA